MSSYTGEGLEELMGHVPSLAQEYTDIHFKDLEEAMAGLTLAKQKQVEEAKERLDNDIA